MNITIQEHGVMLTDYFHGTSGVWLNIQITPETTVNEVLDMIKQEIDELWDHCEYVAEHHGVDMTVFETGIDCQLSTMRDYVKKEGNGNNPYAPGMEFDCNIDEEQTENPVAIFTIEFND